MKQVLVSPHLGIQANALAEGDTGTHLNSSKGVQAHTYTLLHMSLHLIREGTGQVYRRTSCCPCKSGTHCAGRPYKLVLLLQEAHQILARLLLDAGLVHVAPLPLERSQLLDLQHDITHHLLKPA